MQVTFPLVHGALQVPSIYIYISNIAVSFVITVETGRRFFPNCSEVLDRFLEDDMQETLLLENGPLEEHSTKKMRYMELKDEVLKAFDKDKAENNWVGLSSSSSCSSSPKAIAHHKAKKRQLF